MTELGDQQDRAEALDDDVLDELDDAEGRLVYPPEHPLGVREYGTTPAEERVDEPLVESIRRETPDPLDEVFEPTDEVLASIEQEELEDLADNDLDLGDVDDETELDDLDGSGAPIGRLVGPGAEDDGIYTEDDEPDAIARSVDDSDDLSAEEDAIHLTPDPPFGRLGDGYISP